MNNLGYPDFRLYGKVPYEIVVIHGGPGAPGEMAPVAKCLSESVGGVLEPLQKQSSIEGQISELREVICKNCTSPVTLIGWSWGAFLSLIFTARYSSLVKKLILVSSGPFESSYAKSIMPNRLSRLTKEAQDEMDVIIKRLNDSNFVDKKQELKRFAGIDFQVDSFDPLVSESLPLDFQYEIHNKVWNEAEELRSSGKLLAYAHSIKCPVVAIHGDYDSHPFQGVQEPLSRIIKNFRFILLENCGHYPWYEKNAVEKFYEILREEIHSSRTIVKS